MLGVLYNSVPVYQSGIYAGGALQFSTRISVGDIHINRVYNNYLLLQGLIPCSTVWSLVVISEISGPLMSSNPLADIFIFLMFLIGKVNQAIDYIHICFIIIIYCLNIEYYIIKIIFLYTGK